MDNIILGALFQIRCKIMTIILTLLCKVWFKLNFKPDEVIMQKHDLYRPQRSWGKVIFSQACVTVHGGCLVPGDAWSQGGAWSWGVPGRGVHGPEGGLVEPPKTATAAGSSHPIWNAFLFYSFHSPVVV